MNQELRQLFATVAERVSNFDEIATPKESEEVGSTIADIIDEGLAHLTSEETLGLALVGNLVYTLMGLDSGDEWEPEEHG